MLWPDEHPSRSTSTDPADDELDRLSIEDPSTHAVRQ
jgi:hypothetical protein